MRKALSDLARVSTNRTIPEILNEQTPIALKTAIARTPKVERAKITAELGSPGSPNDLAISIILSRSKKAGKKISLEVAKRKASSMIRARLNSVRYVSLGWLPALGKFASVKKPINPNSQAGREGFGKRATSSRHYTIFRNAAQGVQHGRSALKESLGYTASVITNYAARKMQRLANQHNKK